MRIVYFIRRGDDGPIKIGTTSGDPRVRLKSLQTASPERLHLIGCMRGSERKVQEKFRAHLISGEWFRPHENLLEFIRANSNEKLPARRSKAKEFLVATRISRKLADRIEDRRRQIAEDTGVTPSVSAILRAIVDEAPVRRAKTKAA